MENEGGSVVVGWCKAGFNGQKGPLTDSLTGPFRNSMARVLRSRLSSLTIVPILLTVSPANVRC